MARERLKLNQGLMLMLFMATTDMVLDTLPTPDQSMEDTPATMPRERLKLNQKLMLNILVTLVSMEDTPPMPDPLFLLSTLDLLSPLSTPDQYSPLSTPEESMDTTKPAINQKDNQRH